MKNVTKGQKLSLEKELSSKSFIVGLNWNQTSAPDYEVDASVMLLSEKGKIEKEENFIFYNNLNSPCSGVKMHDRGINDYKKSVIVDLNKIATDVSRLMFIMTIDNGDKLNQRFENIKNIVADIVDESNKSIVLQYNIEGLTKETAVIAIEIYKHNNEWKLQANGNGFNSGLDTILKQYGGDAIQVEEASTPTPAQSSAPVQSTPPKQDFAPPKISQSTASKVPVGSKEFIKEFNGHADLVNRQLGNSGLNNQKAQVVVALDLSCSMSSVLKNGTIQDAFDRIMPLAMRFDDDGIIDVFLFHDEAFNHPVPFTMDNRDRYIQYEILFKYFLAGAKYGPVINKITSKYASAGKGSDPVYVCFFTDGDCEDAAQAEAAIKEASSKGIFWQFIGIGGNKAGFAFLNKLDKMPDRKVDNANFCHVYDLNKISEDELYKRLLAEFPDWIKTARQQGIIN